MMIDVKDEGLYHIKGIEFYHHDEERPSIIIQYICEEREQNIKYSQVFIANECLEMDGVFNKAHILHEMLNKHHTISVESDIIDTFKTYLNISGNWSYNKVKVKFNREIGEILRLPKPMFTLVNSKLQEKWFEEQYRKNGIEIGD